jgi:hypothetical protein
VIGRAKSWRAAGLFFALAFTAASAIPFLSPEAQAEFSAHGFGAPPLLILALAAVLGSGSLWILRERGFFAGPSRRTGIRRAVRIAAMLALVAIGVDLIAPVTRPAGPGWPDAWLFHPALAVATLALAQLLPLTLALLLTRNAIAAIVLAALCEAGVQTAIVAGYGTSPLSLLAAQVFLTSLVQLWLFRRHGLGALIAFAMVFTICTDILWDAARLHLALGGA